MRQKRIPRWAEIWAKGWMILLAYLGAFALMIMALIPVVLAFDSLGWPLGWAVAISDNFPRMGHFLGTATALWAMWPFAVGILTIGQWIQELLPEAKHRRRR